MITELIARLRSSDPPPDVLSLCEYTEGLLSTSLKIERTVHEAIKILEGLRAPVVAPRD